MKLHEASQVRETSRPRFKFGYRGIQPRILEALNVTKRAAIRTVLSALALTACNEAATGENMFAAEASMATTDAAIHKTSRSIGEETRNVRDTRSPGDISEDASMETVDTPNETTNSATNDTETINLNDTANPSETTDTVDIAADCLSSTDELKINPKAVNVIGHWVDNAISYTSGVPNNGSTTVNHIGLSSPHATAVDTVNHRLFVSDTGNSRVLVYNLSNSNTLTDYTADKVLGQQNFTSNAQGTTAQTMAAPEGLAYDSANNLLYAADYGNKRILVYDVAIIENGEAAVKVLCQADFTSNTAATTQSGCKGPRGLAYDRINGRLFGSDAQGNHRIMVFNTADGIDNGENAMNVLGQANFTSSITEISQNRLNSPYGLAYDEIKGRLFSNDTGNHRIMIFNTADGIDNGENAMNVLGQANFTSNIMATTSTGMSWGGYGLAHDNIKNRLFVSDVPLNRILVYDTAIIINGEAAIDVLGQPLFTESTSATTQAGLSAPYGVTYESGNSYVYVSDSGNNRAMVFDTKTIKCEAKK